MSIAGGTAEPGRSLGMLGGFAAVAVTAWLVAGCRGGSQGTPAGASAAPVTYARDVAPILAANCVECHHPGGAGPFSLQTYDDARRRAAKIVKMTRARVMPPWLPDPREPEFIGARRLTAAQIALLSRWVEAGTPRGDPAIEPAPADFRNGWQLGTPDLVLEAAGAWTVPADGPDVYRNFVLPVPIAATRYVRGLEILPGNHHVTHHANVLVDRERWARARDAGEPGEGFAGMDLQIPSNRFDPDSHFLFWKPGTPPAWEPGDMSLRLDPGTDLVLNVHIRPSGRPEVLRPSVGLYFTTQAPTRTPMLLQLERDGAIDIPAGESRFTIDDALTLPVDVQLVAIYPHAHYLGREVEADARRPDGSLVPLVRIRDWDPSWQGVYRYPSPVPLPAGTELRMRWRYDNSAGSPRNPSDPPVRVRAGDQSTDEMGHVWLQVVPARREDLVALQEALMRRRLAKYPGDFSASANLASVLQLRGRLDEAVEAYRRAIRTRSDVAAVHNGLGTALVAKGAAADALPAFAEAARLDPGSTDVQYNWGNALLALGRARDALPHFERVVRSAPADASALNDYGTALAMSGRLKDASAALARALRARPDHPFAHYNLARVLVQRGRPREALPHYEAAVRLDPANRDAADELTALRSALGRPR